MITVTIGLQKLFENTPTKVPGNFWRTGQVSHLFDKDNTSDFRKVKIQMLLYPDIETFNKGAEPLYVQNITVIHHWYELFMLDKPFPEKLYDRIVSNEENNYFSDAIRITVDVDETLIDINPPTVDTSGENPEEEQV